MVPQIPQGVDGSSFDRKYSCEYSNGDDWYSHDSHDGFLWWARTDWFAPRGEIISVWQTNLITPYQILWVNIEAADRILESAELITAADIAPRPEKMLKLLALKLRV